MKKIFSFLAAAAMLLAASCSTSDDFDGDLEIPQPANEIWYTSSDSSIVTPNKSDVFGANIISNTYENGKGVIKFDGSVTSIGSEAFCECTSLISINIPNGVTSIEDFVFHLCI